MKIVAVTACPTGIAHTYMAAEALQMAAKDLGHDIKVETQGSVGAENVITSEDLKTADAVIIAADTNVNKDRFMGLPMVVVSVKDAIKDPKGLINKALAAKPSKDLYETVKEKKQEEKESRKGIYKHLMTGVSYMIPFVVAGGILIALSFAFGIKAFEQKGSLAAALMTIGGGSGAMGLIVPILSGFIAFSIADRPGLVPGMVGGVLSVSLGASFLGGLVSGFLAGYTIVLLKKIIKLPKSMEGLMPVFVLPILSTLIVGLIMVYIVGGPAKYINNSLSWWLNSLSGTNAILLGAVLGLMMAFDMGGAVNKAAYTFAIATVAAGKPSMIMAAVMAAGMTPPLGIALSTVLTKNKYTAQEIDAGKANWVLGISFITEGAIPFAAADPLRVIPAVMIGSAVTGALSMFFKCTLAVPHGGIFTLFIPKAIQNVGYYALSIVIGTIITAAILSAIKKKIRD